MGLKIVKELRDLSGQELSEKLGSIKQKLLEHRLQAGLGRLEKPSEIKKLKRDIARILTIKKELQAKK